MADDPKREAEKRQAAVGAAMIAKSVEQYRTKVEVTEDDVDCVDDGEAGAVAVAGEMFATITGEAHVGLFIIPARDMEARGQTPCIVFHRSATGEIDGLTIGIKGGR